MVSFEKGITFDFKTGALNDDESIDLSTTKNIRWVAKLGSQAYGNVTIGEGKVIVGTNNESNRDYQKKGDRGVVMCFDEKTGKLEWQLVIPKLGAGKVSDWEYIGVCSSSAIEDGKMNDVLKEEGILYSSQRTLDPLDYKSMQIF